MPDCKSPEPNRRYEQCNQHGCTQEWEFTMVTWNGWPTRRCPFHAADWDRRNLAKLTTEVQENE